MREFTIPPAPQKYYTTFHRSVLYAAEKQRQQQHPRLSQRMQKCTPVSTIAATSSPRNGCEVGVAHTCLQNCILHSPSHQHSLLRTYLNLIGKGHVQTFPITQIHETITITNILNPISLSTSYQPKKKNTLGALRPASPMGMRVEEWEWGFPASKCISSPTCCCPCLITYASRGNIMSLREPSLCLYALPFFYIQTVWQHYLVLWHGVLFLIILYIFNTSHAT